MFKQDDKVVHEMWGEGRVAHGPFRVPETTAPCYLVKNSEGAHFIGSESLLKPVPRFEVDQKVTFKYASKGEVWVIVSGPYPTDVEGDSFWVIKDSEGAHDTSSESYMVPVVE